MDRKQNYFKHQKCHQCPQSFSSLKLWYFTEINYLETDVMFHKTAVAEWPLPAGDVIWP